MKDGIQSTTATSPAVNTGFMTLFCLPAPKRVSRPHLSAGRLSDMPCNYVRIRPSCRTIK
ncbi:Hypothetical protein GbCGDNIH1_7019 [Granulibacter bethesdensis CGDNIH1]|uniref:Uncharacterized protein n=1 Tax=Granulibacter bethesdensis (strain ATCC BAA-1260 / CGDNIH1) TaxID=391165 RepID=A0A286M2V6_GRABC|nr:Hypothetical protein GbCGDNIH1I4_7019 [Granulibacter bethesdensis]ASV62355.1 Hypothetical protein GbCGDNIH1_7019 [Granulibacter bethesdensis CGDNIH1]